VKFRKSGRLGLLLYTSYFQQSIYTYIQVWEFTPISKSPLAYLYFVRVKTWQIYCWFKMFLVLHPKTTCPSSHCWFKMFLVLHPKTTCPSSQNHLSCIPKPLGLHPKTTCPASPNHLSFIQKPLVLHSKQHLSCYTSPALKKTHLSCIPKLLVLFLKSKSLG